MTTGRVLVTGGAGFIGSHLCDRLVAMGKRVVCADNLMTGRRENLERLLGHERFEFVEHDIVRPLDLEVDEIYNLACPASPVHYRLNPVKTVRTNVVGTVNVLELARRAGARVLQASTSEVYGDPEVHPQPESYWGRVNPIGPRACYDEGKRCAETLCMDYRRQHGVDVRIARIFNTYGPRMALDDGRVVSNFAVAALLGRPVVVHGDGSQTRSFCYVDDMVEGLVRLMALEGPDTHEPVNLGNPDERSILDLARLVLAAAGRTGPIVHEPRPEDDPLRRRPDISRARSRLGWEPKTGLEEGLARTLEDFRGRMRA